MNSPTEASAKEKARELIQLAIDSAADPDVTEYQPTALLSFVDSLIDERDGARLPYRPRVDLALAETALQVRDTQIASLTERIRLMEPVVEAARLLSGLQFQPTDATKIAAIARLSEKLFALDAASTEGANK